MYMIFFFFYLREYGTCAFEVILFNHKSFLYKVKTIHGSNITKYLSKTENLNSSHIQAPYEITFLLYSYVKKKHIRHKGTYHSWTI